MKISCEIVKDLLPLYHDDVCSIESRAAVDEHLQECEPCKNYLDNINGEFLQTSNKKREERAKSNILRGIKKKLVRKNVMISTISFIFAAAILFGGFMFLFHYQMPIPYEDGLVSVEQGNNGMIDVSFKGDDYYCSYEWTTPIEKDGIKQYVAYIYYTDTIWTKHFSKQQKGREYKYSINNRSIINYNNTLFGDGTKTNWWINGSNDGDIEIIKDISAVYYLDYSDINKMSKEDLQKISSKAILLWEK